MAKKTLKSHADRIEVSRTADNEIEIGLGGANLILSTKNAELLAKGILGIVGVAEGYKQQKPSGKK